MFQLVIALICFLIDTLALYWWDDAVLQCVTAYFFANLLRPHREPILIFTGLLIGLESFIIHGRFGVYLFPIIPCYLLSHYLTRRSTLSWPVPYLLFTCTLLVNWFFVDPYIIGFQPWFS